MPADTSPRTASQFPHRWDIFKDGYGNVRIFEGRNSLDGGILVAECHYGLMSEEVAREIVNAHNAAVAS